MPKLRRATRFHSLRRVRLRQNWNKYNLFNMQSNYQNPYLISRTFFQQKWAAKAVTRGYHGEHIREKQWERMFSRRLRSVTEFNPRYMARFDGSEQSSGRGSGRQQDPSRRGREVALEQYSPEHGTNLSSNRMTPYMQMTYAPMERRLDIAVFRALFASSARQARQFVVHGAVTVNGRKMVHPGYILSPGDLFQVDPDHVLLGTGMQKRKSTKPKKEDDGDAPAKTQAAETEAETSADTPQRRNRKPFRNHGYTVKKAERVIEKLKTTIATCEKAKKPHVELTKLSRYIHDITPKWGKAPSPDESALSVCLSDMMRRLQISEKKRALNPSLAGAEGPQLTPEESRKWERLMENIKLNDVDPTKPYATPWRPRPFMRAFAFIPRYLEVNQNICAAVYLRHPVCRPGFAEVPTPFAPEISQLAHSWYLRRG